MFLRNLFLALAMANFVFIGDAFAYLDPGTGSFILQLLMVGLLSALATAKMWFATVRAYFDSFMNRLRGKKSANTPHESTETDKD